MKKLEKSIRHEMNFYGPALRARKWSTDSMCENWGAERLRSAFMDIDAEQGICTNVQFYRYGEVMSRLHYYELKGCVEITGELDEFLRDYDTDWNCLIRNLVHLAQSVM